MSAVGSCGPGTYLSVISYRCILNSSRCSRLGASWSGLRIMDSSGLWSVGKTTCLPYTYTSNFSRAKRNANNSFSICAYWDSVDVKAQLAQATTFSPCKSTAHRPFSEASAWTIGVFVLSKYCNTGTLVMAFLTFCMACSCSGPHHHCTCLEVSCRSGCIIADRFGTNLET